MGASNSSSPQPKDFVATIDATEGSPCFGQVISEADVPTSGNEPHHAGMNQDNTVGLKLWLCWAQPCLLACLRADLCAWVTTNASACLRACAGILLCCTAVVHAR